MSKKNSMKIKIALMFGGKSAEHDISIISALQAYRHLDKDKYEVFAIYISKNCEMYYGADTCEIEKYSDIDGLLKKSCKVELVREKDNVYLVKSKKKAFSDPYISRIDFALPVVHGTNAEDGTLQGYLQMLDLPYGGCDVMSSALGMDKYFTKVVLSKAGIPVLHGVEVRNSEYENDSEKIIKKLEEEIGYPMVVKPVNCGSSIGISLSHSEKDIESSVEEAFTYSDKILCERAITDLREINCSVLGDSDFAEASECEEPLQGDEILSFRDKYGSDGSKGTKGSKGCKSADGKSDKDSAGMASLKRKIPAPITSEEREFIRQTAVKAFKALGCSGVSRIDFLMDSKTHEIYFNEINTIPGSLSFYLWEPLGMSYKELLDKIISLGLKRERRNKSITFSFESSVLSGMKFPCAKGAKGTKI